ncbi:hypothetical protein Taro_052584 [Colocasia esculenta]|uniref:Uncharacterized protein n=1 Tax=Colocasia esculenta TaxID=4460 RepID=A0A843XIU5_COLES|nr:hypothetical protein [Colocasia esculenta]
MNRRVFLLVAALLLASALSSGAARDFDDRAYGMPDVPGWAAGDPGWGGGRKGTPGFPGGGGGWGNMGGGWGAGYGSPSGGYSRGGIVRPSAVCSEKGPCYKKKLTCPAKCFTSYSRSGKNYGAGGGGGGCTIDCKKCVAYC